MKGLRQDVTWHGANHADVVGLQQAAASRALADAAKAYDWARVLRLLENPGADVNGWRVGGPSGYTVLHQAAHGGSPVEVMQALLERGSLRTQRTAAGERAVDVARRKGLVHLLDLLQPVLLLEVDPEKFARIEAGVNEVIRERAGCLPVMEQGQLRLPPLELLTEIPGGRLWFPVPGMYGGFVLQLGMVAGEPLCIMDSWCRVVEGSEERHLVSCAGVQQIPQPDDSEEFIVTPNTQRKEEK